MVRSVLKKVHVIWVAVAFIEKIKSSQVSFFFNVITTELLIYTDGARARTETPRPRALSRRRVCVASRGREQPSAHAPGREDTPPHAAKGARCMPMQLHGRAFMSPFVTGLLLTNSCASVHNKEPPPA
jgi:hypothetical protein